MDVWVQSQANPGGICGEQCDSDFASRTLVFPCQYHSTNAPNSCTYHVDYSISPTDSTVNITYFKRMLAIKETDKNITINNINMAVLKLEVFFMLK
jgi:hypothetical protein